MKGEEQVSNHIIGDKFQLTAFLGKGGFGNTYGAFDLSTNQEVAIKITREGKSQTIIEHEAQVSSKLSGAIGFPKFVDFLHDNGDTIFAMEFLGRSLSSIMEFLHHPLSLKSVYMVADQTLCRIQYLHQRNYIHCDIKPENFLIGRGKLQNCIYLIDFGLSTEYRDSINHSLYPQKNKVLPVGTSYFSSLNSQLGHSLSRRDDIESLAYSLIYLAKGSLPWSKTSYTNKITSTPEFIASDLPPIFSNFLTSARHLCFDEEPPYSEYRSMFRNALLELEEKSKNDEEKFTYVFEWEGMENLEPPLPLPIVSKPNKKSSSSKLPVESNPNQNIQKEQAPILEPRRPRSNSLTDKKDSSTPKRKCSSGVPQTLNISVLRAQKKKKIPKVTSLK